MNDAYRIRIEQIDADLKALIIELESEIDQKTKNMQAYNDNEWMGSNNLYQELLKFYDEVNELIKHIYVCIECQIMANQLVVYFPNSSNISKIRLDQIRIDIGRIAGQNGVLERAKECINKRTNEIHSSFNWTRTVDERRKEVGGKFQALKDLDKKSKTELEGELMGFDSLLQSISNPMEMLVMMSNGKIHDASVLE